MAHRDVEREAAALRAEINRHNRLYYVDAAPKSVISNTTTSSNVSKKSRLIILN